MFQKTIKILTVLGARPQFIKSAPLNRAIHEYNSTAGHEVIKEIIIHTGQHFDANMSEVFFQQLNIPQPNHYLGVAGLPHGAMTGRMLEKIEALIEQENPNWVLVYGDTNSTLAAALAAAKTKVPIAHIEAGLRSHNLAMPEEINRILTDRISSILLCPTATALKNLSQEGFPFSTPQQNIQKIKNVGDVMYDAVLYYRNLAYSQVNLDAWKLEEQSYVLCTLHRQENTNNLIRLESILKALRQIAEEIPVVIPLHPRTYNLLKSQNKMDQLNGLKTIEPVPYLEMQRLEMGAKIILTDSGGVQKEAFFHAVPCITLRDETEWVETIEAGWNKLVGSDSENIVKAFFQTLLNDSQRNKTSTHIATIFGDGYSSHRILDVLLEYSD